jgi:CheY-like chemotaxis protein
MPIHEHILYVEDDPLSRDVMQMLVDNIIEADSLVMLADSADFVQRVQALQPSPTIILLDIHVKPIDGFEMLRQLRALETLQNSKIVALTASVMNEEVEQLRESGFDGAIAKPLSVQEFPSLIERIVRGEHVWHIGD